MSKIFKGLLVAGIVAISGYGISKSISKDTTLDVLTLANIEALALNESSGGCVSGGPGAISCSFSAGGQVLGTGGSFSCSVSCSGDYYACCGLSGCTCIEKK